MESLFKSESHSFVKEVKTMGAKDRLASYCICCGNSDVVSSPAILMPFISHRVFNWKPVEIDASWNLHSIKTGNAYSICNSLYCTNCGFCFLDIRFSDSELSRLYDDYRGPSYVALRSHYEPGYAKRNEVFDKQVGYLADIEEFLRPHLKSPITVLDWGGDTGINTPFKDHAASVEIFDIRLCLKTP
jgi:hypothetical protein